MKTLHCDSRLLSALVDHLVLVRPMQKLPRRLTWSDMYSILDDVEEDEVLDQDAILRFPHTPTATAFITELNIVGDRIVAHARYDGDTSAEYWCVANDDSIPKALSIAPLSWLEVRSTLEEARRLRRFESLAVIGFPPDFADESFSNFITALWVNESLAVAMAFFDPA